MPAMDYDEPDTNGPIAAYSSNPIRSKDKGSRRNNSGNQSGARGA